MKKGVLIIAFAIYIFHFAGAAYAKGKIYGSAKVLKVVSVYDGDTFRANISGFPDIIGKNIPIRIHGIDTPESRGKRADKAAALKAKAFTVKMLNKAKVIELKEIRRGKYFRIVARVIMDGVDLGNELLKRGFARPFMVIK